MSAAYRGSLSTVYNDGEISTCRQLIESTVYNDGEISTCRQLIESTVYNDGEISTCGWIIEVHSVQSTMMGRSQHVGGL